RLVALLGSFITARSQYALARLEFAIHFPDQPSPPVIDRLLEPSERALREEWPHLEEQLELAIAFERRLDRTRRDEMATDEGYRWLQRSLRELDQYARAIRWVMTVTEQAE
ncbi:MAG TPA: hypothetical protein VNG31_04320, partial [Candidatus Baltobacteraceae bacterium]|nr:hypothetical protein [Candidatus Baltobacteraceae bacterium]